MLVMQVRGMRVLMYLWQVGVKVGMVYTRIRTCCFPGVKVIMMTIVMPVPMVMHKGRVGMLMTVLFSHQDENTGQHQAGRREKYQAG